MVQAACVVSLAMAQNAGVVSFAVAQSVPVIFVVANNVDLPKPSSVLTHEGH